MNELSLASGEAWRPRLADAAQHHLGEAVTDARDVARHLTALAGQEGLGADYVRRLRQLAGLVNLAADGAQQLLAELV